METLNKNLTKETLRFYWQQIRQEKLLVLLVFLGFTIGIFSSLWVMVVVKDLINLMGEGASSVNSEAIRNVFLELFGVLMLDLFGWRLGSYSLSILEPRVIARAGEECFKAIHQHSYDFFNNEYVGALVKRVVRMSRSMETVLDLVCYDFYQVFLRLSLGVIVLWVVQPYLGLFMLLWSLVFLGFNLRSSMYKLKHYDAPAIQADSAVSAHLADTLSNNVNLKLFSSFDFEEKRFKKNVRDWKEKQIKSWVFNQHIEMVQNLLMVLFEIVILYWAVSLWENGALDLGEFVLIQGYFFSVLIFIWDFGRSVRRFYECLADAGEMTEILLKPVGITDFPSAKELKISGGEIEFKAVDFAYQEGDDSVLSQFDLKIQSGEKVAFIGPSGGGKTTIVKLLLRLFDVNAGEILIDGQNVAQVTQESLRRHLALVPQDPMLFHRTLMENIRYGRRDASDEEVIEASKLARCHDFISKFPKAYDTQVGERGVKLSGGERQRIAIARAILSHAKILILDEATSSLDVHSEKAIQEALHELIRNKTTLFIAHRLSTVMHADRIIAIKDGKIVEEGPPKELLKKEGGLFQSLWGQTQEGVST